MLGTGEADRSAPGMGSPQAGRHYCAGMSDNASVLPAYALVVDDNETALDWAGAVGAQTVLCRVEAPRSGRRRIASLAELPFLLGHTTTRNPDSVG